jgi:hypothetical protein
MTSDELYSKTTTNYQQGKINNKNVNNNFDYNYNSNNDNHNHNHNKKIYETQYSNNKINFEKKKSNRRHTAKSIDFLCSHNNITGNENKIVDDFININSKKLFENIYYRKSLSNLYREDLEKIKNENKKTKNEPNEIEIIHALKTKKHFVIYFI